MNVAVLFVVPCVYVVRQKCHRADMWFVENSVYLQQINQNAVFRYVDSSFLRMLCDVVATNGATEGRPVHLVDSSDPSVVSDNGPETEPRSAG